MAEPISVGTATIAAAALAALGQGLGGVGSYLSEKQKAKIEKKKVKEMKRKTFADLLNDAMNRSHDTSKDVRHSQSELAGARARAMQETAAGIRQSLAK